MSVLVIVADQITLSLSMLKYRSEAKKRNIPFICTKRTISCVYDEYIKIMGIKDCSSCYANCTGEI